MTTGGTVRLASFNALHGLALHGDQAATSGPAHGGAFADGVRLLDADILALQEVDAGQERSGYRDQVRDAAEALDAGWWHFAPTMRGPAGPDWEPWSGRPGSAGEADLDPVPRYGIGLVSRLPMIDVGVLEFPVADRSLPLVVQGEGRAHLSRVPDEPRAAIRATIETPAGPITFAATHLSFVPGVNVRQLRQLRAWLAGAPRPLILAGDFNLPGNVASRVTGWTDLTDLPTYPSQHPRVQFDHVLADGLPLGSAEAAKASAAAMTLPVSDHCAVTVDLDLRPRLG